MMHLAAAAIVFIAPQEPPKVTYDDSGDFRLLAMDLDRRFRGRVRFEKGLAAKDVSVSLKDAGYFEALDALCRAHKEATYFSKYEEGERLGHVVIAPGTWIELPGSYHGHFKTMVVGMSRTLRALPRGDEAAAQVHLAFLSPPWIPIGYYTGSRLEITVEEALASDGRDVRIPGEEDPEDRFEMDCGPEVDGPLQMHTVRLRDVDLSKGLKTLRGSFKVMAAESKPRRLEATTGSVLETPSGRLTVKDVQEFGRSGDAAHWRVTLSYSLKAGIEDQDDAVYVPIERIVKYEGFEGWTSIHSPWVANSPVIETIKLEKPPRWIELRIRGHERIHVVPFRFSNVAFKGESR